MADEWEFEDVCGDRGVVYSASLQRVGVRFISEDGDVVPMHFDLPRLRALIAELTRRAALLAGEAGEAPSRPEIPAWVRRGLDWLLVNAAARTAEQQEQIDKATEWIIEHSAPAGEAPAGAYRVTLTHGQYEAVCGILLGSKVAMPGLWTPEAKAALEAIRDAPTGEAPARTAEDERADVVAWLRLVDGFVINTTGAADRVANGCHVGFAGLADSGPGYYAGRDDHGRQVVVHADTLAGLARVSAAAGVARWSGPHASHADADAGKALDAEGGQ